MNSTAALSVFESAGPPVEDLAREAWLLDRAADGEISLFLTSWTGPVVVLGYAQSPDEADLDWCRREEIPVLRRLTGGTGVVHTGDLGVGLSFPADHPWAKDIVGLYSRFLDVLEPALGSVGSEVSRLADPRRASRVRSPVCFLDQLADTLVMDGKKVVGCAQTRRRTSVLIHAAVLLGLDPGLYAAVFRAAEDRVASGLAPALSGIPWLEAARAIAGILAAALDLDLEERQAPEIDPKFIAPWATEKWAPVL